MDSNNIPTGASNERVSPSPSTSAAVPSPVSATAAPKAKKPRRSKVAEACRELFKSLLSYSLLISLLFSIGFCRRSHMSCDAGRPCGRCVKRDIAHLCREENIAWETPAASTSGSAGSTASTSTSTPKPAVPTPIKVHPPPTTNNNLGNGLMESPLITSHLDNNYLSGNGSYGNAGGSSGMNGMVGGDNNLMAGSWNSINGGYNPQLPMLTANFNLAMVNYFFFSRSLETAANELMLHSQLDLASGQDGMGTSLGLDPELTTGDGEFHGLGLRFVYPLTPSSFTKG